MVITYSHSTSLPPFFYLHSLLIFPTNHRGSCSVPSVPISIIVPHRCYDAHKKQQSTEYYIKIYAVVASCAVCMSGCRGWVWSWLLTDESVDIELSVAVTVLLHTTCCLLPSVAPKGRLEDETAWGGLSWPSILLSFFETAEGIHSTAKCFVPMGTGDSWHGNDCTASRPRSDCLLDSLGELNCILKDE